MTASCRLGSEFAFPSSTAPLHTYHPGLTKREWMAAMIMQGLVGGHFGAEQFVDLSMRAVRMADELLEELAK